MAFGFSLRALANKVFGKAPVADNDNRRRGLQNMQFTVSAEEQARASGAPVDNSVVEIKHGVPVSDPFRPLEDLDAPETAAWVDKQNARFEDYIKEQGPGIKNASDFMTDALNYDNFGLPSRYGKTYFRTAQPAGVEQSMVQVSDSEEGPWRTLIDPNQMSKEGIVALSKWVPTADGTRVAYLISKAGSDAETLYILDTATGENLSETIEDCRFTSITWDKDSNSAFRYTYPTHDGKRSNIVKHHTIGQNIADDKTVYKVDEPDSGIGTFRVAGGKYDWASHYIGTDNNGGIAFRPAGSEEPFQIITAPKTYGLSPIADLEDGSVIAITNHDAPRGKMVKFDPKNPAPENWTTIIEQSDVDVLNHAKLHKGKLYAFYTQDTADAVRVFTPEGTHLHDMPLPLQSVAGYARINTDDDHFMMTVSSWKERSSVYRYDTEKNTLDFVRKGSANYDLADCIVERVHATSRDGTQVPMTIIRHPDTKLDGSAASILYGYGGFNVPLTPGCNASLAHFVRSGGIYVQANLRGGGEYGEDWYNGGRLNNKQNVFDDFIACAEHLQKNNYTSRERLVINGGSNGGLLTSATMLQRPELFGAVITEVAVTDMFRFHLATYGSAWKSDYGDPDIKEDFNVSARYSPLHNVKPGAKYPPHLIMTADHDDRVVPWHSFKLAATLQAKSSPDNVTVMRVEKDAGHGAGRSTQKYIQEWSHTFAFIEKAVGPVNQNAYQAKLDAERSAAKKIVNFVRKFKPGA